MNEEMTPEEQEHRKAVEEIMAQSEIPLDVTQVFSQKLVDDEGDCVYLKVYETVEDGYIFVIESDEGGVVADSAESAEILLERLDLLAKDLVADGLFQYPSDDIDAAADESE